MKTSNLILALLGLFLLAFIVTMIVVFCVKGEVPDTLIQYTLGAGGVEALLLAGIKISKVLGPPQNREILRGEEEQGSGRSPRRQTGTELSGLCDDETGYKPGESEEHDEL